MTDDALTYVFLAGYGNSGPDHWQTLWYRDMPGSVWVEHRDWLLVTREQWVVELEAVMQNLPGRKLVIAHSLGCLTLVEWASEQYESSLAGAFLVAIPDPAGPNFPSAATGFRPARVLPAPCPAVVVASHDDTYAGFDYAEVIASCWDAELADVGARGHINADSGLGAWEAGRELLTEFVAHVTAPPDIEAN